MCDEPVATHDVALSSIGCQLPGSRAEARAIGASHYFSGVPCKRGHLSRRRTESATCLECFKGHAQKFRKEHPDKKRDHARAYYVRHREEVCRKSRNRYSKKPAPELFPNGSHLPVSRKEAEDRGEKYYFTGKPCKNGHLSKRLLKGACHTCALLDGKKRYSLEYCRSYSAKNREKRRSQGKIWRQNNADKVAKFGRDKRAKRANAVGIHSAADILALFKDQRGKCAYFGKCGTHIKNKYHVDHIVALSRGGTNFRSNLQLLCPNCNCRKHAKDPIMFAQEIGFLL